jgi:hypothetical protein
MNEEMMKSLASLIDESLAELEELKKSNRFSASEIKLDGPGQGIGGKDPQGSLGKEEDKDDEEEEEEEDEDDEEDEEAKKAEGSNREADPNGGKHQVAKGEMSAGAANGSNQGSAAGSNREADPNGGKHQVAKDEDKEDMKKSLEEQSTLLKSYVDSKFASFESQLDKIAKMVQDIADAPVPSKGVSYKGISALKKSEDAGEGEPLTKSSLVNKLFELKKSGARVDSIDIASAELASGHELAKIANKYNIK